MCAFHELFGLGLDLYFSSQFLVLGNKINCLFSLLDFVYWNSFGGRWQHLLHFVLVCKEFPKKFKANRCQVFRDMTFCVIIMIQGMSYRVKFQLDGHYFHGPLE